MMIIHFNKNVNGFSNDTTSKCLPAGRYNNRAQRIATLVVTNNENEVTCPKCKARLEAEKKS